MAAKRKRRASIDISAVDFRPHAIGQHRGAALTPPALLSTASKFFISSLEQAIDAVFDPREFAPFFGRHKRVGDPFLPIRPVRPTRWT